MPTPTEARLENDQNETDGSESSRSRIRAVRIPKEKERTMRSNLILLGLAAGLAAGVLFVAGCGGGAKTSAAKHNTGGTANTSLAGTQTGHSSEQDCSSLSDVSSDLELGDATGSGFDYVRDRDFMDGYRGRAPDAIADSVKRLSDVVDKFASVAQEIGLEPNNDPLPDQLDQLKDKFHYSDDDQAANARAVQTIDTWVTNGCTS